MTAPYARHTCPSLLRERREHQWRGPLSRTAVVEPPHDPTTAVAPWPFFADDHLPTMHGPRPKLRLGYGLCVVLCGVVWCCFAVSLHFNTKLAPDAPSPRRIQSTACWGHSPTKRAHEPSACNGILSRPDSRELIPAPSQKLFRRRKTESVLQRLAKVDSGGAPSFSSPLSAR